MIRFNSGKVDLQLQKLSKGLSNLEKSQIPFAASRAINKIVYETAFFVRKAANRGYHLGATRFTQSGFQYTKSTKQLLNAVVYVRKDNEYILNTTNGGVVKPKKRTLVQPVQININKYGNITRGKVRKLASNKDKYFIGKPKGRPNNPRYAGLWERPKDRKGSPRMLVSFKNQRYQKRFFPAQEIGAKYARRIFPKYFNKYLSEAILTAL